MSWSMDVRESLVGQDFECSSCGHFIQAEEDYNVYFHTEATIEKYPYLGEYTYQARANFFHKDECDDCDECDEGEE